MIIWHLCQPDVQALDSVRSLILPVMPDITHPMLSVILNRWVTVAASRSLSCVKERPNEVNKKKKSAGASVVAEGLKEP